MGPDNLSLASLNRNTTFQVFIAGCSKLLNFRFALQPCDARKNLEGFNRFSFRNKLNIAWFYLLLHFTPPILKKLAVILLTLIVCYNTVGYFIVFKARQLQVKAEIKKMIKSSVPEAQLVVFRYSPATRHEFKWIHSKEFRYKGSMYDVVKKSAVSPTETDIYCIHDVKESGLFRHLDYLVKEAMNHSRNGTNTLKVLSVFFAGLFPPPDFSNVFIPECTEIQYTVIPDLYTCSAYTIISPPPRS